MHIQPGPECVCICTWTLYSQTNRYKPVQTQHMHTLGLSIMVMALLHSNGWCWQRKMFHVLQWASHSSLSSALLSRLACGLGRRLKPNVKYIYECEKTQWDYRSEKQLVFPTARLHIWCDSICGAVGGGWGTWREGFGRWWWQDYIRHLEPNVRRQENRMLKGWLISFFQRLDCVNGVQRCNVSMLRF